MTEHVNPRGLMKTSVPGVKGTAHRWWQLDEGRICWWWTWIGSLGRGCGEGGGAAWHGIPVWVEDELSLQPSRTEGLTSNPMEDNIHKLDWAPCCLTAGEKRHLGGQVARAAILEARSLTDSGYIHTITPSSAPRIYMLTLLYFSIKALPPRQPHPRLFQIRSALGSLHALYIFLLPPPSTRTLDSSSRTPLLLHDLPNSCSSN